jgi:hypothetical protein
VYPEKVSDGDELKGWLRTRDKTHIENKSEYKKERTYNLKDEQESQSRSRSHRSRGDEERDGQQGQGGQQGGQQGQQAGCPVQ